MLEALYPNVCIRYNRRNKAVSPSVSISVSASCPGKSDPLTHVHHQRDSLHLNGRGSLKASRFDVLNDPGIQLVLLLKRLERAQRVRDVGAVHIDPVLMPDLVELKC